MGTVIQAGHIFSGGTIVSIPPAGGDSTLYYLVSSHLPSDYAVYLYDSSGNELVRIPKPNDASDSWGNNIGTNDTKIAITDNDGNGALYIYDMDGSNMVEVTSSDASGNDRFGSQLEINSTKIIVGAPYAGPIHQQGSVYVYDLDGTNEVKITASDGAYGDQFSTWGGLTVSESKIFVGSGNHDNKRGALYIYDMDGSNEVKVQSSDNAQNDEFGYIVVASETKVVATAAGSGAHGAAYIFDHDGTNEVKVEPSVDSRNNAFGGASAAINDTHVAIADRAFNGQKGAIYIYNIDGTNEVRIEHPSHFAPYDFFGYNLAMSSSKVFTCPPNDDDGGSSTGNVYEYNLDGTGERTLPTPSTFAAGSRFGQGLYIYDSSLVPSAPTFIAPPSTGGGAKYYVVTAYQGDDGASGAGGAYVFDANDPTATPTKLTSPDPYQNQFLGMSSAASSNHIVLGTWRDDGGNSGDYGKGAAYVYDANDLTATPTKLTAFDGQGGDRFGRSVAASSDKIYVGAPDVNSQGTSTTDGAVYVYDANDLSATPTRIDPFDAQTYPGKSFGVSVDVNSDHLFVGAFWGTTPTDSKMGAVYVYDVNDLSATPTKLTAFDDNPDDNARFGQYLSASSDHLVVGSYRDLVGSEMSGSAYVYDLSDLSAQPTKIGPFDANSNDNFGAFGSIAVSSSYVIVGSKGDDDGGSMTGSVYVYDLNDLSATPTKITEPSPEQFAEFSKVAVLSDKLIIGAGQGGGVFSGTDTGTAYIYDLNDLSAAPTQLLAGDGQSGDMFGESVSIVPTPSTTIPTFIAPSTTSSTVANKIFMFNSDYASIVYTGAWGVDNNGSTSHGGLLMTDASFANPITLSSKTPQSVAGGEGKVVSIDFQGEISVYDSSTGALETTFNDTLLDNAKASSLNYPANSCVIGAGKIFINSQEHNPNGVGSIIVVDLLDRNVPSFLITPALGNYSRLGHQGYGKLQFIDGKIHAGTNRAPYQGIHSFDPDGSNHTFIPTTFAPHSIVKFGDNYVVANEDHGVEIISPTGQVLHSKQIGIYGFGRDIDVTSTNKLVVRRHISQYNQAVHIYDEGFTNEIIISHDDQPNTSGGTTPVDSLWLYESRENSGGLQTINGDILVAATRASSDTVNESGAIYRYNDSGVLQEIFYGTVASQRLGTDITIGTETTT